MTTRQAIEAVRITGPAILLLILGTLYIYDVFLARPQREKIEKMEHILVQMRETLCRIDERTLLLIREDGALGTQKITRDK